MSENVKDFSETYTMTPDGRLDKIQWNVPKPDPKEVVQRFAADQKANPRSARADPALRRRDIRSMLRWAGPFTVTSFGNGLLEIRPSYTKDCKPPECKVDGSHYCAACECNHVPGFMTRIELARRIEVLLNREARKR